MYVQDRLKETGSEVWQLLQAGAHIYVCGDAAHMATAVEEALLDVIAEHQVRKLPSTAHAVGAMYHLDAR